MALVVEDGTGKANAESYISVADADTYHSARGNAAWAAIATDALKEEALRRATDYMLQKYRLRWYGERVSTTQALDWPRNWVEYQDYAYITQNGAQTIGGYLYYPADEVPEEVKRACAELALKAASATLYADQTQQKTRVKVGPIETEYDKHSSQSTRYVAIDGLLSPFLKSRSAVRTVRR